MDDPGTLILILIATLIPLALWIHFIIRNRAPRGGRNAGGENRTPIILGQQLADAQAKEDERLERTDDEVESPLPEGDYEHREGEFGLLKPSPQAYDQSLRDFCAEYSAESSAEKRDAVRDAIPMMDCYTLMSFAERCALFALRERDAAILQSGLTAIAAIDVERTDFRDLLVSIGLLNHSATRLEMDVAAEFEAAARLSTAETAELLRGLLERDPGDKVPPIQSWGYREVELDSGIGFVSSDFRVYRPQHDLIALGIDICTAINRDPLYGASRFEIATDLPQIWLSGVDDQRVEKILSEANAGMNVHSVAAGEDNALEQMLVVFTVELDSPESAQTLLEISQQTKREDTVTLGFAKEVVFSLIVARSTTEGVESIEKGDSLERFSEPINKALGELKMTAP